MKSSDLFQIFPKFLIRPFLNYINFSLSTRFMIIPPLQAQTSLVSLITKIAMVLFPSNFQKKNSL